MCGVVVAILGVLAAGAAVVIRMLARRVVGVEPRRKTVTVRRVGDAIELPRSDLTIVDGNYGLWFGERFEHHALIGPVVSSDGTRVTRLLLKTTAPMDTEPFEALWTGHTMSGPAEIDPDWEDVTVPLRDGASAPAWLFRGTSLDAPWVIHVQGIRTSRLVTLRSVEVAQTVGLTSLAITYRGSGDGPPASASTLGQREWTDLADAVAYARSRGASSVYVVAWSMGAGLALELLRQDPAAFDRLALIAPATNWRAIVHNAVRRAGLPRSVALVLTRLLESRFACLLLRLPVPLDFDRLCWSRGFTMNLPTIVVHSRGDEEIPFELSRTFALAGGNIALVETRLSPHGWEANVDPDTFGAALKSWLS
ncbi:alpha/beta hydrolase family protein [Microbacterium laevaniformans]|uniref:alpha/beta hydrolase family protein n=1 Tax=Microbacterium laevaniformans TaxID=36807 RepID=UPI0022F2667E|nr:alpha/beta hydrolase [Microbacterium laevaniformans]